MSSDWGENHGGEISKMKQMEEIYNLPAEDHEEYDVKVEALT
jgi:hypothetical protein